MHERLTEGCQWTFLLAIIVHLTLTWYYLTLVQYLKYSETFSRSQFKYEQISDI